MISYITKRTAKLKKIMLKIFWFSVFQIFHISSAFLWHLSAMCGSICSSLSIWVTNFVWILYRLEGKKIPKPWHLLNLYLVFASIVIVKDFELWVCEWTPNWDKFRGSLAIVFGAVNFTKEGILDCSGCCRCGSWAIPKPGSRLSLACYRWDTLCLCFSLGITQGHSPAHLFECFGLDKTENSAGVGRWRRFLKRL